MAEVGAPRSYNPMFETFVRPDRPDEEQLGDLVAYALYKRAKAQWTTDFKKRNDGRGPTSDELTAYHHTWTEVQVEALRNRAWAALGAFGESLVVDARPGILKEALRGRFWPTIGLAMFASFLYTLVLIASVLLLRWAGVDALGVLEKASPSKPAVTGIAPGP